MPGDKEARPTLYAGNCPVCLGSLTASLIRTGKQMIPPPILNCCCSCQLPVVPVQLVYQGQEIDDDDE